MGKALIIAEKPSLAKNICAAIGKMKTLAVDGETVGSENDEYIVTSAFGHLLALFDVEDYNADYKKWDIDVLPIIPQRFMFKVKQNGKDDGSKKRVKVIEKLLSRADVDCVINAGDSDREGEIIIRNILLYVQNKKPVYRLWMPDQTPQTINDELKKMRKDSEYDALAAEGYARTFIDWLYGINLTRLATVKSPNLIRVGRVTTPIITAICERERAIRDFKSEKYYVAQHDADGIKLTAAEKFGTKEDCGTLCSKYNKENLTVKSVSSAPKTLPRPKLLCLSDLQGICGKLYSMSPADTLAALQELYEAQYCTYPRTDSRYMATAEKDKAKQIIAALVKNVAAKGGPDVSGIAFRDSKYIFDDSKVETHSAITPTTVVPDISKLSLPQSRVYNTILMRFATVFCKEEYTVQRTEVVIANSYEEFKLSGDVTITKGYTVFEKPDKKEANLPPLAEGQVIKPMFSVTEKETQPPNHYTADSLNKFLKNPYNKEEKSALSEDDETKDVISEVELGTEATRAGLIAKAINDEYITLKNNRYGITKKGEAYVDILKSLEIDMTKDRTLNLSKDLKAVYRQKINVETVVNNAAEDLRAICETSKKLSIDAKAENATALCNCLRCGSPVRENSKAYYCTNKQCGAVIFKDDSFFKKMRKKMSRSMAKAFFTNGSCECSGLYSAKKQKTFSCTVKCSFPEGQCYPKYEFVSYSGKNQQPQDERSKASIPEPQISEMEAFATCPKCGSDIIKTQHYEQTMYVCKKKCGVFLYKEGNRFMTTFGKEMTDALAKKLFAKETVLIEGFVHPKNGRAFSHEIQLQYEPECKIVWADT